LTDVAEKSGGLPPGNQSRLDQIEIWFRPFGIAGHPHPQEDKKDDEDANGNDEKDATD
jgi:hypothetical protein